MVPQGEGNRKCKTSPHTPMQYIPTFDQVLLGRWQKRLNMAHPECSVSDMECLGSVMECWGSDPIVFAMRVTVFLSRSPSKKTKKKRPRSRSLPGHFSGIWNMHREKCVSGYAISASRREKTKTNPGLSPSARQSPGGCKETTGP